MAPTTNVDQTAFATVKWSSKEYSLLELPFSTKRSGPFLGAKTKANFLDSFPAEKLDAHRERTIPDQFLSELESAVLGRNHDTLIEDDFLSLTGLEAKLKIEEYIKALNQISSEGGYVAIALPSSSSQALIILATMLSKRIPVVVYPTTAEKVLPSLQQSGRLQAVVLEDQSYLADLPVGKLVLSRCGRITSMAGHQLSFDSTERDCSLRPALVIYTSGSSGNPKPVAISFKCLDYIVHLMISKLKLDASTVSSISMPLFHTLALNTQFLPTIMAGGRCTFSPAELQLNALFRGFEKANGTYLALIPDVLVQCFHEFVVKGLSPNHKVKTLVLAGANIRSEHLKMAEKLFPSAEIFKGYGLTEAIRVSMISNRDPDFFDDNSGYPLSGQIISIRSTSGLELGSLEEGQIFIKGPNTSNYYLGSDKSLVGEDGFLATGDTGYLTKKGQLVVLGREDRVFKSQGRKIAPLEIEKIALVHPSVTQAVCIPKFCQHKGYRATLFLKLSQDTFNLHSLAEMLERAIRSSLEPFKRPKEVFVSMDLPKLPSGKNDLETLKMHVNLNQIRVIELLKYRGIDFIFHDASLLNRTPVQNEQGPSPSQNLGQC
jgi:acyl-coenzyme A synthetase/AMP-(fatty) acid ligase